jgi:hypothetical protein
MRSIGVLAFAAMVITCFQVKADLIIKFDNGPGSSHQVTDRNGNTVWEEGGEFVVKDAVTNQVIASSFCVETNEYMDFTHTFNVSGFTDTAYGGSVGASGDPLDARTAYLYTQFVNGTLTGYAHTDAKANALQDAIWYIEGEITNTLTGDALAWYNEANAAVVSGAWSGIGNVRIMNITWVDGPYAGLPAQDQLVMVPVPEATTVLLLGLTFFGGSIPGLRRLRRKK